MEDGFMANKSRVPLQVAPEFEQRIKNLQIKIRKKQGENISLREITKKIAKTPSFEELEKAILNVDKIEIKLNLDKRK